MRICSVRSAELKRRYSRPDSRPRRYRVTLMWHSDIAVAGSSAAVGSAITYRGDAPRGTTMSLQRRKALLNAICYIGCCEACCCRGYSKSAPPKSAAGVILRVFCICTPVRNGSGRGSSGALTWRVSSVHSNYYILFSNTAAALLVMENRNTGRQSQRHTEVKSANPSYSGVCIPPGSDRTSAIGFA